MESITKPADMSFDEFYNHNSDYLLFQKNISCGDVFGGVIMSVLKRIVRRKLFEEITFMAHMGFDIDSKNTYSLFNKISKLIHENDESLYYFNAYLIYNPSLKSFILSENPIDDYDLVLADEYSEWFLWKMTSYGKLQHARQPVLGNLLVLTGDAKNIVESGGVSLKKKKAVYKSLSGRSKKKRKTRKVKRRQSLSETKGYASNIVDNRPSPLDYMTLMRTVDFFKEYKKNNRVLITAMSPSGKVSMFTKIVKNTKKIPLPGGYQNLRILSFLFGKESKEIINNLNILFKDDNSLQIIKCTKTIIQQP